MTNSDNVIKQLRLTAQYIKQGQTKEAQALLKDLIKTAPDNPDVWYLASHTSQNKALQLQMLERAMQLNPDHRQARARYEKLNMTSPVTTDIPKKPEKPASGPSSNTPKKAEKPAFQAAPDKKPRSSGKIIPLAVAGVLVLIVAGFLLVRFVMTPSPEATTDLSNQAAAGSSGQQDGIQGERIVFFDGDGVYFIRPDATDQTLMYTSNDVDFNYNHGEGLTWSPDGSHFAFTSRGRFSDLTLVHDPSGQTARLLGTGLHPAWSPDGSQVVMAGSASRDEPTHLIIVNFDGSNPRSITTDDAISEYNPLWAADGQRIVFVRREAEQDVIYTIKPDGTEETRLTAGSGPQLSPDSSALLFRRDNALYRINADGSGEMEIISLEQNINATIAYRWSPDSLKIAYSLNSRLNIITADNTMVLWVSPPIPGIDNFVWSPDSQRLLGLFGGDFNLVDITTGTIQLFIPHRANENQAIFRFFSSDFAWLSETQISGVNRALEEGAAIKQQYTPAQPDYFPASVKPVAVYRFDGGLPERLESPLPGNDTQKTSISDRWSPDGKQIVISLYDNDSRVESLYLMNADGSNLHPLTPNGFYPQWSPDSQRIGFLLGNFDSAGLYVIDATGGEPVKILEQKPRDGEWVWSPDSQSIAYSNSGDLTIIQADGTNPRVLTRGASPDWSPDGQQIAYRGFSDDRCICVIPADGSAEPTILMKDGDQPAWSPDGKRIAFEGGGFEIYTMNADGSDVRRMTHSDFWKEHPVWSPDGLFIAYWEVYSDSDFRLNVMHADGTGQQQLAIHPIMGAMGDPYWLPAAVHASLGGFQAATDERTPTPIPTVPPLAPYSMSYPTVEPTLMTPSSFQPPRPTPFGGTEKGGGTGLLFYSEGSTNSTRYFTVDLQSPTPTGIQLPYDITQAQLLPDGKHYLANTMVNGEAALVLIDSADFTIAPIPNIGRAFDFALSPDGSRIAYLTDDPVTYLRQVWVVNIDGTGARQLTQHPLNADSSFFISAPDWSPDGKQLAYVYNNGTPQVRVINVDTLDNALLVEPGWSPAWSPDGKQVAYVNGDSPIANIYIANADGSNAHPVTDGKYRDDEPDWSPNGLHIAFFRTGSLYVVNADGSEPTRLLTGNQTSFYGNLDWQTVPDTSIATFTPAPTITPSYTPTATATATPLPPSATPNPAALFKFTPATGRASIQLSADNPESFLVRGYMDAEGKLTLEGVTQLESVAGEVGFFVWMGEPNNSDFWTFRFYAPDIEVGRTYDVKTRFGISNELNLPAMSISSPGSACSEILGDFVVEQAAPEIIVSFTHYCEQDTNQKLSGRIVFTP